MKHVKSTITCLSSKVFSYMASDVHGLPEERTWNTQEYKHPAWTGKSANLPDVVPEVQAISEPDVYWTECIQRFVGIWARQLTVDLRQWERAEILLVRGHHHLEKLQTYYTKFEEYVKPMANTRILVAQILQMYWFHGCNFRHEVHWRHAFQMGAGIMYFFLIVNVRFNVWNHWRSHFQPTGPIFTSLSTDIAPASTDKRSSLNIGGANRLNGNTIRKGHPRAVVVSMTIRTQLGAEHKARPVSNERRADLFARKSSRTQHS